MDKVKQVAEDLAVNGYPEKAGAKDDASTVATQPEETQQPQNRAKPPPKPVEDVRKEMQKESGDPDYMAKKVPISAA